jgi:hypothetical protein
MVNSVMALVDHKVSHSQIIGPGHKIVVSPFRNK